MFYSILARIFILCALLLILFAHKFLFFIKGVEVSGSVYCSVLALFSLFSAYFFTKSKTVVLEKNILKEKIKKEASEIDTQEYKDKVERLNAKIETLELALKDALKK